MTGGWGPWTPVPDWFSWENQGGDIALADLDGDGRPELAVLAVDNPAGRQRRLPHAVDLALDIDTADVEGVRRLLDFGTEVLAIHAALLHTGDVVFSSGSSNNPANVAPHDFRTRVWHYPKPQLSAPATPIDLFCCGTPRSRTAGCSRRRHRALRPVPRPARRSDLRSLPRGGAPPPTWPADAGIRRC